MVCLLSSLPKYTHLLFLCISFGAFPTPTSLDTGGAPDIPLSSLPKECLGTHLGIPNGRSENIFLEMSKMKLRAPNPD